MGASVIADNTPHRRLPGLITDYLSRPSWHRKAPTVQLKGLTVATWFIPNGRLHAANPRQSMAMSTRALGDRSRCQIVVAHCCEGELQRRRTRANGRRCAYPLGYTRCAFAALGSSTKGWGVDRPTHIRGLSILSVAGLPRLRGPSSSRPHGLFYCHAPSSARSYKTR